MAKEGQRLKGVVIIDEQIREQLKEILIQIASAEASEVLKWGKDTLSKGTRVKMSKEMSRAVSSIKLKASGDTLDLDIKLLDKLKAIELYFKLCEDSTQGQSEEGIQISYDYISSEVSDD